jgi:glycosyltransferase involved in cell wall biosynthesis
MLNKQIKVAFILPSLAYKGPILIAQSIVNDLSNLMHIDVYYFDEITETEFNSSTNKISFFKKIDFNSYDIIHTHMLRPDLYIMFWSFISKINKPIITTTIHQFIDHDIRNQHSYLKAIMISKLWHFSFRKFNTLIVLNEPMFILYTKRFPSKHVVKIHNGRTFPIYDEEIPVSDIKLINDFKKDYVCLGSAAQITKNKGFDQILNFLVNNNQFCFILIGDGVELNNLKSLAKTYNLLDRVLFLGKRNNARRYFNYFDVFVMCSEKEGFPVSLLEAASMSLPTVCTKNKIFESLFSSNEVSFFEQNNLHSLKLALDNVINEKEFYSKNIYDRYQKDYISDIMTDNYFKLYKSILNN